MIPYCSHCLHLSFVIHSFLLFANLSAEIRLWSLIAAGFFFAVFCGLVLVGNMERKPLLVSEVNGKYDIGIDETLTNPLIFDKKRDKTKKFSSADVFD